MDRGDMRERVAHEVQQRLAMYPADQRTNALIDKLTKQAETAVRKQMGGKPGAPKPASARAPRRKK